MVIINSYVKLPEGNLKNSSGKPWETPPSRGSGPPLELGVVLLIDLEELLPIRERLDLKKRGSQKWSKDVQSLVPW